MTMPTPAFWSLIASALAAAAALLSAVSALIMMRIQRRNFFEASRPELVIAGWQRHPLTEEHGYRDAIFFDTVRNIGRGAAVGVWITGDFPENPLTALVKCNRVDILAAGDAARVRGTVPLWWQNAPADGDHIAVNIYLRFDDDRGMHHETCYSLLAAKPGAGVHVSDEIAPGLAMGARTTKSMPLRRLRRRKWLARVFQRRNASGRRGVRQQPDRSPGPIER